MRGNSAVHSTAHHIDIPHVALRGIEQRLLWLSTVIVHHANRIRPNTSGIKVGGHQASSASMVTIMTSLWFGQLQPGDRVSVKPHASPVLHGITYLIGELDASYLPRLREFGGLQSYPSRTKDPDPIDHSTGSVGIVATGPIWGAIARRYVDTQIGAVGKGRQFSLVGDAEPDEGAAPMLSVLDGHPHMLALVPAINGAPGIQLGGHSIDTDSIVGAALDLAGTV